MQKKYGFKPLGAADGPVKTAIFGGNNMRLYGLAASAPTSATAFAAHEGGVPEERRRRAATCATATPASRRDGRAEHVP